MSQNPYHAPKSQGIEPVPYNDPRSVVSGPATGLMIVSITSMTFVAISVAVNIALMVTGTVDRMPDLSIGASRSTQIVVRIIWGGLLLASNTIVLVGAVQMKGLRSFGLAVTASIVALIPCIGPCYLLGIPFGIWAGRPQ